MTDHSEFTVGINAFVLPQAFFDFIRVRTPHEIPEEGVMDLKADYPPFLKGERIYVSKPLPKTDG